MSTPHRYRRATDPEVVAARIKSYTSAALVTLFLYALIVPGLIANVLYYREAKERERIAGRTLPGVGFLTVMLYAGVGVTALSVLTVLFAAYLGAIR